MVKVWGGAAIQVFPFLSRANLYTPQKVTRKKHDDPLIRPYMKAVFPGAGAWQWGG